MRKRITFEHAVDYYLGIPYINKYSSEPRPNIEKWRKSVYERDEYKCQICQADHNLNAHHIMGWKNYPDYRYDIDNGITLCLPCHQNVHRLRPG
jgi:5-methylcytosine-specific restriction endonuclease McrA